ncbi:MAG: hypothetical protein K1X74_09110 [Pirellulales bacterium]|nr:hypothetical protein [Pirellulales bacterium]
MNWRIDYRPRRAWALACLGFVMLGTMSTSYECLAADSQPATAASAAIADAAAVVPNDVQDFYVLARVRPLLIRVHLLRDGQSYQTAWGRWLWQRFNDADKDHSGMLDDDEFLGLRADVQGLRRSEVNTGTRSQEVSFLDCDVQPVDGLISLAEFVRELGGLGIQTSSSASRTAVAPDRLTKLLDRDTTAGLSNAEGTAALTSLSPLDSSDDEMISFQELDPEANPLQARRVVANSGQPTSNSLFAPSPGPPLAPLAVQVFAEYDLPVTQAPVPTVNALAGGTRIDVRRSPGDGQLTPEELVLGTEAFATADADHNGALDAAEFTAWFEQRSPDGEFLVRLGRRELPFSQQVICLAHAPDFELKYSETNNRKKAVLVGDRVRLELTSLADPSPRETREASAAQFTAQDRDKNDYLDRNEIGGDEILIAADQDGNGMVFLPEYLAYRERLQSMGLAGASATLGELGSTLPEALDTNKDQRLSARELMQLPERIADWDRNRDGQLAPEEVPQSLSLTLGYLNPQPRQPLGLLVFAGSIVPSRPVATVDDSRPKWFVRMDRNADGDVSRREFLGPLEMFERADADHDGLLSPQEADSLRP